MRPRSATVRPTRRFPKPSFAISTLVVGAAVILAACGSSDSNTKTSGSGSTTSTTEAATTSTAVVKTATDPDLGTILVDADGRTLYTLTDGGVAVACTGGCLSAWPPLLLPAGTTTATGSADVTELGTTASGSDLQVTHAELPLYRFAADAAAGDANGEGIASFGGTWHVVKIGGASAGSSTSTTEKSDDGY